MSFEASSANATKGCRSPVERIKTLIRFLLMAKSWKIKACLLKENAKAAKRLNQAINCHIE